VLREDNSRTVRVPKRALHRVWPAASAHACSFATDFSPRDRTGRLTMRLKATSSLNVAAKRR